MAIRLITGVPGGGKSYYAVHMLAKEYCDYDKETDEYKLKNGVVLITNIENLLIPHKSLDEIMEDAGKGPAEFFAFPYQEKIAAKYPKLVYVIDEAQQYFRPQVIKGANDVFYYFERHRKLGHDVYLITQDKMLVHKNISAHIEEEIRSLPRSAQFMNQALYVVKTNGIKTGNIRLSKKKEIFRLYQSFLHTEVTKPKNTWMKWILIFAILSIGSFAYAFSSMKRFSEPPQEAPGEMAPVTENQSKIDQEVGIAAPAIPEPALPETETLDLNYIIDRRHDTFQIYVYHPIRNCLIPSASFPYYIKVQKVSRGLRLTSEVPTWFAQMARNPSTDDDADYLPPWVGARDVSTEP